jgi:ABC-type antimicrobial peptide transport system permease subunit
MLIELIAEALVTLRTNILRTILTMIGIILGVGAVVAIMTLGTSAYATVEKSIYGTGAGNISITHSYRFGSGSAVVPFDDSFINTLKNAHIDGVVSYEYSMGNQRDQAFNTDDDSLDIRISYRQADSLGDLKFVAGGPFENYDVELHSQVAVIDVILAEKLFGSPAEAVGQTFITGFGLFYKVTGVVEVQKGNGSSGNVGLVYVPMTLAELSPAFQIYGYDQIAVKISVDSDYEQISNKIKNHLMEYYGFEEEKEMSFDIGEVNALMNQVSGFMRAVSLGLSLIAAISLIVGGVGIMNIMLVSVTERTKEIGLMKALGAKDGDIVFQFLVESVVMTIFGGLIGISLGLSVSLGVIKLVNTFGGDSLPEFVFIMDKWSMVVSMGVSVAIGLVFGAYPARRAAKLRPVEALRRD